MQSPEAPPMPMESPPDPDVLGLEKAPGPLGPKFTEACALLLLWSMLVLNEGAFRFNLLVPYDNLGEDFGGSTIPRGVLFFAALFEIIFGFIGLFLSLGGLVFRFYDTAVTQISVGITVLLGWFVFIVWVLAFPSSEVANFGEDDTFFDFSLGLTRFSRTLGILLGIHLCLALQGGQFIFMCRLITTATGRDFLMQKGNLRLRAMFWNLNLALGGLWILIAGCIVVDRVGGGTLEGQQYAFGPITGRNGPYTVFIGLAALLWGLVGVIVSGMKVPAYYYILSGVVYFLTWLHFTIVQFGLLDDNTLAGLMPIHSGLVFVVALIGPYFVYLASREDEDEDEKLA